MNDTIQVGDILHAAYQYSSRHNYWYTVVRRTAKTVDLVRVERAIVSDDGYGQNGREVPRIVEGMTVPRDEPTLKGKRVQVSKRDGSEYVSMGEYVSYARKWNGEPQDFYTD